MTTQWHTSVVITTRLTPHRVHRQRISSLTLPYIWYYTQLIFSACLNTDTEDTTCCNDRRKHNMSSNNTSHGAGWSNIACVIKANHQRSCSGRSATLIRHYIRHCSSLHVNEVVHNGLTAELQCDSTNVLQLQTAHHNITTVSAVITPVCCTAVRQHQRSPAADCTSQHHNCLSVITPVCCTAVWNKPADSHKLKLVLTA